MNYIKIDENARMLLEDANYTLEWKVKSGIRPDGKKSSSEFKWVLGGYFPTLASLCQDYISNAPRHLKHGEKPLSTMKEVVEYIQKADRHINNLIKGI
jgi:hypothetical protein